MALKRPWNKYSQDKPWIEKAPAFGSTRIYNADIHTTRWRKLRKHHLSQHPTCAMCERMGRITVAVMVDHINPIAEGGEMWDENNLQSLCAHCHKIKTNKEISRRKL